MVQNTDIELEAQESGQPIPLEAGTYPAVVEKVEPAPGGTFGDQVKFYLKTEEMGEDGEPIILWAWASMKLTTASKLFGWVTAITGSPPELGKRFVINELLAGKPCRVSLGEETKDGTTRKRVTDILAPGKAPPTAVSTADTCSQCNEDVFAFTAQGTPFCASHMPKIGE